MRETDHWPFSPARWFTEVPADHPRAVRLVVIHDMEAAEKGDTAENVSKYFAGLPAATKASAHLCIDNNSIVQCVHDRDVAYAAPGANADGIQLELAGYGRQTREQWLDEYGLLLIENAANATAQYCLKFELPVKHLTNDELRAGAPGIVGHYQVSEVYGKSDHTDPGPNFPWDYFLERVAVWYAQRSAQ